MGQNSREQHIPTVIMTHVDRYYGSRYLDYSRLPSSMPKITVTIPVPPLLVSIYRAAPVYRGARLHYGSQSARRHRALRALRIINASVRVDSPQPRALPVPGGPCGISVRAPSYRHLHLPPFIPSSFSHFVPTSNAPPHGESHIRAALMRIFTPS